MVDRTSLTQSVGHSIFSLLHFFYSPTCLGDIIHGFLYKLLKWTQQNKFRIRIDKGKEYDTRHCDIHLQSWS